VKYIKEYNLFSENGYYKEVSIGDFYNYQNNVEYYIAMSQKNIDDLFKILKDNVRDLQIVSHNDSKDHKLTRYIQFMNKKIDTIYYNGVTILEIEDYYFKVIIGLGKGSNNYYICDQIDGVIELLKDKKIL
jgi:hypothetical protein